MTSNSISAQCPSLPSPGHICAGAKNCNYDPLVVCCCGRCSSEFTCEARDSITGSGLWQPRLCPANGCGTEGERVIDLNLTLSWLSNSSSKVLSAQQTTLDPILIMWGSWISSKLRRDWLLQSSSRHLMLSPIIGLPHALLTTWQSRTATEQPWWRRPAAPLLGASLLEASSSTPPCRPRSPAPATQSRFTFTLITILQGLVGGSPGEQWHQVPEHLYIRLSDSLRSCL